MSLAVRLDRARLVLTSAQTDAELATVLAEFGYNAETLEQGWMLYEQARTLQRAQEREYGARYDATVAVAKAREDAKKSYKLLSEIARVALHGERGLLDALGLEPTGKKSIVGWLDIANRFYSNALASPTVLDKLARFNITRETLAAGQRDAEALEQARRAQERERAKAREATKNRDHAMKALSRWINDFLAVARVALAQRPHMREKLGLRGRA